MRHRLIALAAAALLALAACGDDEPLSTEAETSSSSTTAAEPADDIAGDTSAGGFDEALARAVLERTPPQPAGPPADLAADALNRTTLVEGEGAELEPGDTVVAHYVGVLSDGTVFDESWTGGQPFDTVIPGQVIEGWNEGLLGVRAGERVRLEIGADLAYGPVAREPIPANAPLAFEIDVVAIIPAG